MVKGKKKKESRYKRKGPTINLRVGKRKKKKRRRKKSKSTSSNPKLSRRKCRVSSVFRTRDIKEADGNVSKLNILPTKRNRKRIILESEDFSGMCVIVSCGKKKITKKEEVRFEKYQEVERIDPDDFSLHKYEDVNKPFTRANSIVIEPSISNFLISFFEKYIHMRIHKELRPTGAREVRLFSFTIAPITKDMMFNLAENHQLQQIPYEVKGYERIAEYRESTEKLCFEIIQSNFDEESSLYPTSRNWFEILKAGSPKDDDDDDEEEEEEGEEGVSSDDDEEDDDMDDSEEEDSEEEDYDLYEHSCILTRLDFSYWTSLKMLEIVGRYDENRREEIDVKTWTDWRDDY